MAATTLEKRNTDVKKHVYLFWYNESDWSVYYYNVSSALISVYWQFDEHVEIVSMAAHDDDYTGFPGYQYYIQSYVL